MPGLVEQVQAAHAYQYHFQQGITDEHAQQYGSDGQQTVLYPERFRMTGEQAYQHIGEHGNHIAQVLAHAVQPVQPECPQKGIPTPLIGLLLVFVLAAFRCLFLLRLLSSVLSFAFRLHGFRFLLLRFFLFDQGPEVFLLMPRRDNHWHVLVAFVIALVFRDK